MTRPTLQFQAEEVETSFRFLRVAVPQAQRIELALLNARVVSVIAIAGTGYDVFLALGKRGDYFNARVGDTFHGLFRSIRLWNNGASAVKVAILYSGDHGASIAPTVDLTRVTDSYGE